MLDTRIAMVQMTCRVADPTRNIARMSEFLHEARTREVDVVCFPELSVSGYNPGDSLTPVPEPVPGPSSQALARLGRETGLTFLAGILERDRGGVVYNTQAVFGPTGLIGTYRKTHVPTSEIGRWSHGSELRVFEHPKLRFGIEICYDSHFPEVSTVLTERGAEVLFLPHASGTGESAQDKRMRWLRYVPARAYDNTVYVAICNQVGDNGAGRIFAGVTFVCDPRGAVIAQASRHDAEEMVVADLSGAALAEARRVPETFFRHFRRPELYS